MFGIHCMRGSMPEQLERNSREWLQEWERLTPLLEEWKHSDDPLLSEAVMESLKKLGLVVPDTPRT